MADCTHAYCLPYGGCQFDSAVHTDAHGNLIDTCGHCQFLPTTGEPVRAVQVGCPAHSEHPDARRVRTQVEPVTAWDLLGIAPDHPGGRNTPSPDHAAIIDAAEAWRQRFTASLVRMQDLDDTEQALIDALAQARCGQCRQCDDCRRDAPLTTSTEEAS